MEKLVRENVALYDYKSTIKMGSLPSDVTTSVEKSAFLMNSKTVKSNMFYRGIAAGSILQNIFAITVTKNSV